MSRPGMKSVPAVSQPERTLFTFGAGRRAACVCRKSK
jgi:hypothetical protein